MKLPRLLRTLEKDERGVSAVEFAMVIPILATLILGIIDLSSGLSQQFTLQQAVDRSLEMVQANRVTVGTEGGTPDYSFLKTEVAAAAKVAEGSVELKRWRECDGAGPYSFEGSCPDVLINGKTVTPDTARYVELSVVKPFKGKMYWKSVDLVAESAVRVQ